MRPDLSIDVQQYLRLPPDVRSRFDDWLRAETLMERLVIKLTLGEGAVTIERHALNADGNPYVTADGEFATTLETIPVRTLPPADVFLGADE